MQIDPVKKATFITPNWPKISNVSAICISVPSANFLSPYRFHTNATSYRKSNEQLSAIFQTPIQCARLHQGDTNYITKASTHGYTIYADGHYTQEKNLACCIVTADCIPILIADTHGKWVMAVHAGWRGLKNDILQKSLEHLPNHTDKPQVWLGPSICDNCYPVGPDFVNQFTDKHSDYRQFFNKKSKNQHANLAAIATYQLSKLGIEKIYQSALCTYCTNYLQSYRRDKQQSNRILSAIWLS